MSRQPWPSIRQVVHGMEVYLTGPSDGLPAIVVSGMGMSHLAWRATLVLPLAQAGYRVCTYDHRPHRPHDPRQTPLEAPGARPTIATYAEDLSQVLQGLRWSDTTVIGYSFGGQVAIELSMSRPALVGSLVVLASQLSPSRLLLRILDEYLAAWDRTECAELRLISGLLYTYSPVTLTGKGHADRLLEQRRSAWDPAQVWASRTYTPSGDDVGRIAAPSLAVGFGHDLLVPTRQVQELAETIGQCRYVEIPDAGHAGPFERPDLVQATLLDFLARTHRDATGWLPARRRCC